MRDVSCHFKRGQKCRRKELISKWRKKFKWWPTCIEHKMNYVNCKYRETLWDIMKKKDPECPPPMPPKRIFRNNARVYSDPYDFIPRDD